MHGVTFVNTSSVSLYTSSIFVYTKVLAHNLNVIKIQILPLDENDYQGCSQRLYHVEAHPKIRIKRYLTQLLYLTDSEWQRCWSDCAVVQAGLSLKCAVCKQLSFAPDYYADFYDSACWVILDNIQISCAGPVESLQMLDHIGDHWVRKLSWASI